MDTEAVIALTATIVSAHLSHNHVSSGDVPAVIRVVFDALAATGEAAPVEAEPLVPAVSIRASVKPDTLVCLECGRKLSVLKRHLRVHHGLTTGEYMARWKLDADYPLTAPDYSQRRSAMAFRFGLGRKAKTPAIPTVKVAPAPEKKKRARVAAPKKKAVDTPAVDPA